MAIKAQRSSDAAAPRRPSVPRPPAAASALDLRMAYAWALYEDPRASQDDVLEAVVVLEDAETRIRRVFGDSHPFTGENQEHLEGARMRREDRL